MNSPVKNNLISVSYDQHHKAYDESAHKDSAVEWWFLQGYFEGESLGRRYFMLSFFKYGLQINSGSHGFSFLLSVLNPQDKKVETISRIDQEAVSYFLSSAQKIKDTNIDQRFIEAYIAEIKNYGPFKPISLERQKVELGYNPLRISWKDFVFSQTDQGDFKLVFIDPQTKRECSFNLNPIRPRLHMHDFKIPHIESMDYVTYQDMDLRGEMGAEVVTGKAWFDHQWGNFGGWFVAPTSKNKILGWDWFGINLDDGTDIMVMLHRDMRSKKLLSRYAVITDKDNNVSLVEDFSVKVLRHWESLDTRVSYPVSWEIKIPHINANLVFEPVIDEQEIRVFGILRAIWEGAGKITGQVFGRQVSGRARLELQGYGYIFDFQDYLKVFTDRIDKCIEDYLPKNINDEQVEKYLGAPHWKHEALAYTATLSKPVWDLMSRQGKHWRPIYSILLMEALGISSGPYEKLTSVVSELSHTGALIIDDIEDSSLLRRGEECIHLRYGLDVAINAGNTIYFLPYLQLANHPDLTDKQRLELHEIMVRQFARSHFGQGLDIYWSRNMTARNLNRWLKDSLGDKILQMYAYKTAAAVEGISEVACVLANANKEVRQSCVLLSRAFGVTFQIIDDVLNFSDSPKWTKTCGEDLLEGKISYVILRALEMLGPAKRRRLQAILCSSKLRQNRKILQEGIGLVRESGALLSCQKQATEMIASEWKRFSSAVPPSEPKIMLHILCMSLLNIAYEI
jgi:geranylgeranyl pyrophosphate synthase/predicted secreted hydrolase